MNRFLPSPLLSASLFALWLVLARTPGPGHVLLALFFAVGLPLLLRPLRPGRANIRGPLAIVRLIGAVGHDVIRSAIEVAHGVLVSERRAPRGAFVRIPLDLQDAYGLAALTMITTVVPGTVWSELALDRSAMLLHVWDVEDEATFVAFYKARYELPLREIFE